MVPGHDIARDGTARDADVEIVDSGRTAIECGATSVDVAMDAAATDAQVGIGHLGRGMTAVGQATGHHMAGDGTTADGYGRRARYFGCG